MPEEGSCCPLPRLPWAIILRVGLLLIPVAIAICFVLCGQCQTRCQCEPPGWDMAELHLNLTGPRKDQRLLWYGNPALGRSFLLGPELDQGQLRILRDGIYRLHVQVTLTNCSSTRPAAPRKATLVVGICSSASHSISLLRLNFGQGCTVASQVLTPLSHRDTLCTNLTLPLLPSRNTDETFFGIQWVHP